MSTVWRVGSKKVTIIIPTWNAVGYTRECLTTVVRNTPFEPYEIIVSDNGSTDGTVQYLTDLPEIRSLFNGENLGFSGAVNRALEASDPESDVVLLNNDTLLLQQDWLSAMQECAYSAPDIGIVGCRLSRPDGLLLHAGTYMPADTFIGAQIGNSERDINQFSHPCRDVEGVTFACTYIKREVIEKVGLLDSDYFAYFEDADYCLRTRAAGFRIVCCGSVTVLHYEHVSTTVNDIDFEEIYSASRATFLTKWEGWFKSRPYAGHVGWHSTLKVPSGYSSSGQGIVTALEEHGIKVGYKYLYGPGTPYPHAELEKSERPKINQIAEQPIDPSWPQVVYGQADVFRKNFGAYRIGFTMFEADRLPKSWVQQANEMDEVWVPSEFNRQTFVESGVSRPVRVVPLGVDPNYFNPEIRGETIGDYFTFLSIFEWVDRKGPDILLKAFQDEFRCDEPVVLFCMVNTVDEARVRREMKKLSLSGGRVVASLNVHVPYPQLGGVYRSADCFVLPTRGEGWGLPFIEAMACGLPVIGTAWGGQSTFLNDDTGYVIPSEGLVEAKTTRAVYRGMRWAQPSYEECRRLMRHVFENRDEAQSTGLRASRYVLDHFTWDRTAVAIIERLQAIGLPSEHGVASGRTGS